MLLIIKAKNTIYISKEYDESFWQLKHSIIFTSVMNMTKAFDNYGIAYYLHQYWIWRKLLTIKTYHTIYISNVYDESFWQLRQHTIYISNVYDDGFWQLRHSILFTSVMYMTNAFDN